MREGGWEVRRIPRGLVKALHNKFFEMFLSSSRENLNLECDSQSGRLKEGEIKIQRSRNGVLWEMGWCPALVELEFLLS